MIIRRDEAFPEGYTAIVDVPRDSAACPGFGIIRLRKGMNFIDNRDEERAFLLLDGEAFFSWPGGEVRVRRSSMIHESPSTLHLSKGIAARVVALSERAELAVFRLPGGHAFPAAFIGPENVESTLLASASLEGTANRTIRSVLDDTVAPHSGMTIGELVNLPGRWSSFPPHHHPHPELYHFRFFPENGFGYSGQGDEVFKVRDGDTAIIPPGLTHPQVAAPGHVMVYLWGIRHLEGNRFRGDSRIYDQDFSWLL